MRNIHINITVMGAGALGCYYRGILARTVHRVARIHESRRQIVGNAITQLRLQRAVCDQTDAIQSVDKGQWRSGNQAGCSARMYDRRLSKQRNLS